MRVSDINVDGPLRTLLEWMERRRMEAQLKALKWRYMLARIITARIRNLQNGASSNLPYLPAAASENDGIVTPSTWSRVIDTGWLRPYYAPGY